MAELISSIQATSQSKTRTMIKTRNFSMIIDEPESLGGSNEGANPVEYLLAALSGCLNVVCHAIAKEMGMSLTGLEIDIDGNINTDKFMGKSDKERTGFKEVRVIIKPETDADESTLSNWLKTVEERCPVSDNIANATPITFSIEKQ